MSFTNRTPNYNLPQYLGSDIPSWLTDFNNAMLAIDTAIKNASESGGSLEPIVTALQQTVATLGEELTAVETVANANTTSINQIKSGDVTVGNSDKLGGVSASGYATAAQGVKADNAETAISGLTITNGKLKIGSIFYSASFNAETATLSLVSV